jgi:hypothetical protein
VIVGHDRFLNRLRWSSKLAFVNLEELTLDRRTKLQPHPPLTLNQTAILIDCSSDEEQFKPVTISHGTLLSRLLWLQGQYKLGKQDRIWNTVQTTRAESLLGSLLPLMFGASLLDPEHSSAPRKATLVCWTPHRDHAPDQRWQTLSKFTRRLAFCSLLEPIEQIRNSDVLVGPEILLCSAFYRRSNEVDPNDWGKPTANVTAIIRNASGQILPPGFPGELMISSPWLGAGFVLDAATTAEQLVPTSIEPDNGITRLFKTGVLARQKENGRLYHFTKPTPEKTLTQLIRRNKKLGTKGLQLKPGSWQHKAITALAEVCDYKLLTADTPLKAIGFTAIKAYKLADKLKHRLNLELDFRSLLERADVDDFLDYLERKMD